MTLVEWPVRHLAGLDLLSLRLSHSFPPQTHTFTTTIYYLCLPQRYLSLSCVTGLALAIVSLAIIFDAVIQCVSLSPCCVGRSYGIFSRTYKSLVQVPEW